VPVAYTLGNDLPPVGFTDQGREALMAAVPVSPASSVHVPTVGGPVGLAASVFTLPSSEPFPASTARTMYA